MEDHLIRFGSSVVHTLLDASFYLLFGLLAAGVVKAWVNEKRILQSIGKPNFGSVVKASLVGIPLPLCSCSVVPMALSIREKGASRGATVSFLISTPETGVDSIAMTYAMMDPLMTVFRPFAAITTALSAGAIENAVSNHSDSDIPKLKRNRIEVPSVKNGCSTQACGCSEKDYGISNPSLTQKMKHALRYAFIDLLSDIAVYLIVGLIVSGLIAAWIPDDWFGQHPEWLMMALMLVMGIPMYVCASASTPVAAALILKGISPGAALVFLLVGPATNIATLAIVQKIMGFRSAVIYITTIMVAAVCFGLVLNWFYHFLQITPTAVLGFAGEMVAEPIKIISASVLACLIGYHLVGKITGKKI